VGAIRGLVEALDPKESQWDVISGVSIGAINAVGFSLFKKGDEDAASQYMIDFWHNLTASKIYSNWPGYIIEGAFWRTGLYNNTRFVDFLRDFVHLDTVYRKVVVGATNAKTGTFVRYTEALGTEDLMYNAVRASSAFPGFFQSVEFDNKTLIDGGVLINLDIAGAVQRCKEIASREKDIIIDIIMCSGDVLKDVDVSEINAIKMMRRYMQISNFQKTMIWITQGIANFPNVKFRYIVAPKGSISSEWLPMGFKPKEIRELITLGNHDAKETVKKGEGKMVEELTRFWRSAMDGSNQDKSFEEFTATDV
jgi:predicted patatin/cPLA2 family phospholipase